MKNFALGRLPSGTMNKTECRYAELLKLQKAAGEIQEYWFEGIKLNLAPNTTYTPDFLVMRDDGILECHEVKGFWLDDARVKIKVAAAKFPFRFYAVKERPKKLGGGYEYEALGSVASSKEASQTIDGQDSGEESSRR